MSATPTAPGGPTAAGATPHEKAPPEDPSQDQTLARGWALFLDFDGTLVEIAERPEAVMVDPGLPGTLRRLSDRLGGALAVISGRPIAALDGFLAPETFDAAGLHGAEHRLGGEVRDRPPPPDPALRRAVAALRRELEGEAGLLVEDKGLSVAVHWRLAPDRAEAAARAAEAAAASLGAAYRLQRGKAVAEIVPAGADKGRIVERFLAAPPYRGRLPVFVGDDLTDEHGFAMVNARGGVSIRVGEGRTGSTPTQARAALASPSELRRWLRRWAEGDLALPSPSGILSGIR